MSTLREQKYDKLFSLLDFNGSGSITHHDFTQMAEHLLASFDEGSTTPKGKKLADEMTNYWNALRERADSDGDGQVSKDEFRQALHEVSDDFDAVIAPLYQACFYLADKDDDGVVSRDEFIAAQGAVGVPARDADATFDRLTENGGQLTLDTLLTAVGQYYRDDVETGSGSHLFFGQL